MKCRAFAKALHYKEEEFHRGPTTQILESLIRFKSSPQFVQLSMMKTTFVTYCFHWQLGLVVVC